MHQALRLSVTSFRYNIQKRDCFYAIRGNVEQSDHPISLHVTASPTRQFLLSKKNGDHEDPQRII
jgi:N6-adenosine-specific RNA methylase IME4